MRVLFIAFFPVFLLVLIYGWSAARVVPTCWVFPENCKNTTLFAQLVDEEVLHTAFVLYQPLRVVLMKVRKIPNVYLVFWDFQFWNK